MVGEELHSVSDVDSIGSNSMGSPDHGLCPGDVRVGESLAAIAKRLNAAGHRLTNGGEFHPIAPYRILSRSARLTAGQGQFSPVGRFNGALSNPYGKVPQRSPRRIIATNSHIAAGPPLPGPQWFGQGKFRKLSPYFIFSLSSPDRSWRAWQPEAAVQRQRRR